MAYGVIRYLPRSGAPEEDPAAFDGWYSAEAVAQQIASEWRREYPNWIVAIVLQGETRFPPEQPPRRDD